jgi:hypothetical protein
MSCQYALVTCKTENILFNLALSEEIRVAVSNMIASFSLKSHARMFIEEKLELIISKELPNAS